VGGYDMKYPKKKDQIRYLGKKCSLTKEYERFVSEKTKKATWLQTKMKWDGSKVEGYIVGFGCTYNGKIKADVWEREPWFVATTRVPHIKVRLTGEGLEIKIPPSDITIIGE